jgi:hypothetical protein
MSDLPNLRIWGDPAIRDALSWYLEVAENRRPAKFRIAAAGISNGGQTDSRPAFMGSDLFAPVAAMLARVCGRRTLDRQPDRQTISTRTFTSTGRDSLELEASANSGCTLLRK